MNKSQWRAHIDANYGAKAVLDQPGWEIRNVDMNGVEYWYRDNNDIGTITIFFIDYTFREPEVAVEFSCVFNFTKNNIDMTLECDTSIKLFNDNFKNMLLILYAASGYKCPLLRVFEAEQSHRVIDVD